MKKPRLEEYGLTDAEVEEIESEQRWREANDRSGQIIGVIAYATSVWALWPTIGPLALFFGIGAAFFIALALSSLFDVARNWLQPAHVRERVGKYRRYVDARKAYDKWFVRTQAAFWNALPGVQFEQEVANLLSRAGYSAQLTPTSDDKGVDIVLGDGTIVQCKAHRKPVGPAVARELYGTLRAQKARAAILVSKSRFTRGVIEFARGKPIRLWDVQTLIEMQKRLDQD